MERWGARSSGWLIKSSHPTPRSNGQQAGGSIQRLEAVPPPCRPLKRAVPVPCHRAGIAAQARARGRAVLGTGTVAAGPGYFRTGPIRTVLVSAQRAWPIWKSLPLSHLYGGRGGEDVGQKLLELIIYKMMGLIFLKPNMHVRSVRA